LPCPAVGSGLEQAPDAIPDGVGVGLRDVGGRAVGLGECEGRLAVAPLVEDRLEGVLEDVSCARRRVSIGFPLIVGDFFGDLGDLGRQSQLRVVRVVVEVFVGSFAEVG